MTWSTSKAKPGDFDGCYDEDAVDYYHLRINAPQLFNHYDRGGQKAKYKGEIFPSKEPVGIYGLNSYEFVQRDRDLNKKGIIAIDLVRWNHD